MIAKQHIMVGIILALVAGAAIVMQNAFNNNAGNKIGVWEMTTVAHGVGFLISIVMVIIFGKGNFSNITKVSPIYLFGGAFGVLIVSSIMLSVKTLGIAYSSTIIFIAQVALGLLMDKFGWFGLEKIAITPNKIIGLIILIAGAIVFRL